MPDKEYSLGIQLTVETLKEHGFLQLDIEQSDSDESAIAHVQKRKAPDAAVE